MLVIKIESTVGEDGKSIKTSFLCNRQNANMRECIIGGILSDAWEALGEQFVEISQKIAAKKEAGENQPEATEEPVKAEETKATEENADGGGTGGAE